MQKVSIPTAFRNGRQHLLPALFGDEGALVNSTDWFLKSYDDTAHRQEVVRAAGPIAVALAELKSTSTDEPHAVFSCFVVSESYFRDALEMVRVTAMMQGALCGFICALAGTQNTDAELEKVGSFLSDGALTEAGAFIQACEVFNTFNKEVAEATLLKIMQAKHVPEQAPAKECAEALEPYICFKPMAKLVQKSLIDVPAFLLSRATAFVSPHISRLLESFDNHFEAWALPENWPDYDTLYNKIVLNPKRKQIQGCINDIDKCLTRLVHANGRSGIDLTPIIIQAQRAARIGEKIQVFLMHVLVRLFLFCCAWIS